MRHKSPQTAARDVFFREGRAAHYTECVMANSSPSMTLDDSPVSRHLLPDRVSASALLFLMHGVNTCSKEIWHGQRHSLLRRSEHRR
jgi:hypothetical protein